MFLYILRLFKQSISLQQSAVKISDQAPRDNKEIINTIAWSAGLDDIFIKNLGNDLDLRFRIFAMNYLFSHSSLTYTPS